MGIKYVKNLKTFDQAFLWKKISLTDMWYSRWQCMKKATNKTFTWENEQIYISMSVWNEDV